MMQDKQFPNVFPFCILQWFWSRFLSDSEGGYTARRYNITVDKAYTLYILIYYIA